MSSSNAGQVPLSPANPGLALIKEKKRIMLCEAIAALALGAFFCWLTNNSASFESTMFIVILTALIAHAVISIFVAKTPGFRRVAIAIGLLAVGLYALIWGGVGGIGCPEASFPLFVVMPLCFTIFGGMYCSASIVKDNVDASAADGDWAGVFEAQQKWQKPYEVLRALEPILLFAIFIGGSLWIISFYSGIAISSRPSASPEANEIIELLSTLVIVGQLTFASSLAVLLLCRKWQDSLDEIIQKIDREIGENLSRFEGVRKSFDSYWSSSTNNMVAQISDHLAYGKLEYAPDIFKPCQSSLARPGKMDEWREDILKITNDCEAVIRIWKTAVAGNAVAEAVFARPWRNWEAIHEIGETLGVPEKIDAYLARSCREDATASSTQSKPTGRCRTSADIAPKDKSVLPPPPHPKFPNTPVPVLQKKDDRKGTRHDE